MRFVGTVFYSASLLALAWSAVYYGHVFGSTAKEFLIVYAALLFLIFLAIEALRRRGGYFHRSPPPPNVVAVSLIFMWLAFSWTCMRPMSEYARNAMGTVMLYVALEYFKELTDRQPPCQGAPEERCQQTQGLTGGLHPNDTPPGRSNP